MASQSNTKRITIIVMRSHEKLSILFTVIFATGRVRHLDISLVSTKWNSPKYIWLNYEGRGPDTTRKRLWRVWVPRTKSGTDGGPNWTMHIKPTELISAQCPKSHWKVGRELADCTRWRCHGTNYLYLGDHFYTAYFNVNRYVNFWLKEQNMYSHTVIAE